MKKSSINIIKINSLGCPSCIIMNNVFNKLKEIYYFEYKELDYDFDDVSKYNVGNILPVFIFYKNNIEIKRLCGEKKLEELSEIMEM